MANHWVPWINFLLMIIGQQKIELLEMRKHNICAS